MSATPDNPRSREGDRMRSFEQIEEALRASAGVISLAAQKLNVHRQRVYDWINKDPALETLCKEIREETLDLAEAGLLKAIGEGSEKSIHFYLDRIGRDRGYGNKTALIGGSPNDPPIETAAAPLLLEDLRETTQDDRDAIRAILERRAGGSGEGEDCSQNS